MDLVVILPVYNGMKYLKDNIQSVLNQNYVDFQFFILDDCSTDGSWEYLTSINDERITLKRNQSNKGLFYNLNYMIKNSSAKLIKLWAQDDIMNADCLSEVIAFHTRNSNIGFSYSKLDYVNSFGNIDKDVLHFDDFTPEIVPRKLHTLISFFVGSIAGNIANVTISREAFNKVGLFREDMKISGDFDMWVRIAKEFPIGFIKNSIIKLRNHSEQLSKQEEFYIFHIIEDIQVYNNLISYSSLEEIRKGKYLIRNYKLLFYYTLMIKALMKGKFGVFQQFFRILKDFDNIYLLTFLFIKNRVLFKKKNDEYQQDNSEFFASYYSENESLIVDHKQNY